jgi:2-polyprenyl-3-methyl-5-hydroxy-6-metoxy-1,4-benzoquinol methylase
MGYLDPKRWRVAVLVLAFTGAAATALGQSEGAAALRAFQEWKQLPANAALAFGDALNRYRERLKSLGATDSAADRTIRLIVAHDEGEGYNRIYAGAPDFNTKPNALLVAAVEGVSPGSALDVGMGQGRNALYLASRGWHVTGFDVAEVGLEKAKEQAAKMGVEVSVVHAADEEFEFGGGRWDLIAIIYALEKRSVHRVRDALKPGVLVVIEAGHSETSGAPFEYGTNELLEIFKGFRILRYEDTSGSYDWGQERIRLVRLVAQKPQ